MVKTRVVSKASWLLLLNLLREHEVLDDEVSQASKAQRLVDGFEVGTAL